MHFGKVSSDIVKVLMKKDELKLEVRNPLEETDYAGFLGMCGKILIAAFFLMKAAWRSLKSHYVLMSEAEPTDLLVKN